MKEECRESDAAHERGRARTSSNQVVPEENHTKSYTSSFVPVGHKPGLLSEFGGVAGWMQTKEMADDTEAPPMQATP